MKVIEFEQKDCARIRPYLDSYLNDELLVETNHEVLKHLESCSQCSDVLRGKVRTRELLRGAVQRLPVPRELEKKIQTRVRRSVLPEWSRLSLALAVCLAFVVAGATLIGVWRIRHSDRLAQSQRLDSLMRIGLDDHVHCALDEGWAWKYYTPEEMTEKLGPEYAGLAPLIKAKIPPGFEVVVAHRCVVDNRGFVHLILRKGDEAMSVSITKKNGESLKGLPSVANAAGVPLYYTNMAGSAVSGFETKDYLIFVVSNLPQDSSLTVAADLAPSVTGFLAGARG